jgi:ABC-type antimicrobial peptide transport system permease subunit
MVVNETTARHYWPGENPVGQCVVLDGDACTQVVGIVQNVVLFGRMDERGQYYLPLTHPRVSGEPPDALLIRAKKGAATVSSAVRREMQTLTPEMPYVSVQSYEELFAPELQPWRLGATMFGVFGALALVIAALGVYSVVAYVATQRTHEIGVRTALGACAADVIQLVLLDGARVVLMGLAFGIAGALLAGHWLQPLLYHTSARDPGVIAVVAALLATTALAASCVPAWRASRVNPVIALRAE